jgi:hypothetical protein
VVCTPPGPLVQVRLLLLAALAGEHILYIGPPGTAKSELGRRLSRLCHGTYFERLLTRFSGARLAGSGGPFGASPCLWCCLAVGPAPSKSVSQKGLLLVAQPLLWWLQSFCSAGGRLACAAHGTEVDGAWWNSFEQDLALPGPHCLCAVPEELFGPLSMRALEEDKYIRQTDG